MLINKERDIITPHKIAVGLLIERYGRLRPKSWDTRQHGMYYIDF